jgi:outer membrane receptor protein involved in Fe transport
MDLRRLGRILLGALIGGGLTLAPPDAAMAGTSGKISGRVQDKDKQPLVSANITVPMARLGAATEADGRYIIVNVPAGTYDVKVSLLGYRAVTVQSVVVSADNTTQLDVTLAEAPLAMDEVVVSAKRPVVDVNLTSTLATLSREQIQALPVQELQDLVNLQAGVVDGHFRGGRKGEVQYQVDGITVNNPYDNTSTLRLDRSLLEEVQVISGTFDAEYGQAMSGVVNAVLRRGTEQFRWDAEIMSGGFAYAGGRRSLDYTLHPAGQQNYQLSVSGPFPAPGTFFLLNGRFYVFDDYVDATRRFTPFMAQVPDSVPVPSAIWKVFYPDGDGKKEPLGYTHEWSGVAKLTNRSLTHIELSYQAVFNLVRKRDTNWLYRLNPDGISRKRTVSVTHGLDVTHTLSKSAFYVVSLRQNYFDYKDMLYDDMLDPRYDAAGAKDGFPAYEHNAAVQGVEFNRFKQNTNSIVLKSTLTSQWRHDQQLKLGTEFEWPRLEFGTPGHLLNLNVNGVNRIVRVVDQPPYYPAVQRYHPYIASAFAQSETEWSDLHLRAGLRADYFNAMAALPGDLSNPANSIPGVPVAGFKPTARKFSVSPRIAVSYPVTRDAALFFAYGHFIQMPGLGQVFTNADYRALDSLQARVSYVIMGNPDLKPEKTVQYQFGYRQAIADWLGVEANVFYKDIRDLLGVEFISTYSDAEYARWTNVDFGSVVGFTVALDQRERGMFTTALDYTWQRAQGNSSDPRETATRAEAGEDPRPRVVPFDWDQRHTLNLTITARRPNVFSASAVVRIASGQPFTPNTETGFGTGLQKNAGRKPAGMVVDVRTEKNVRIAGLSCSAFGRIFNLLDTRFFNGSVFETSGSPYYSRLPGYDRDRLADPTRFYQPRRIEIGLTLSSQQAAAGGGSP